MRRRWLVADHHGEVRPIHRGIRLVALLKRNGEGLPRLAGARDAEEARTCEVSDRLKLRRVRRVGYLDNARGWWHRPMVGHFVHHFFGKSDRTTLTVSVTDTRPAIDVKRHEREFTARATRSSQDAHEDRRFRTNPHSLRDRATVLARSATRACAPRAGNSATSWFQAHHKASSHSECRARSHVPFRPNGAPICGRCLDPGCRPGETPNHAIGRPAVDTNAATRAALRCSGGTRRRSDAHPPKSA